LPVPGSVDNLKRLLTREAVFGLLNELIANNVL
jgi:hypothetical protein